MGKVNIRMKASDGIYKYYSHLVLASNAIDATEKSSPLLSLAARDIIENLEEREKRTFNEKDLLLIKNSIIELSIASKVLSKYTSLIAIEKRKSLSNNSMELRIIPSQIQFPPNSIANGGGGKVWGGSTFNSNGAVVNYASLTESAEDSFSSIQWKQTFGNYKPKDSALETINEREESFDLSDGSDGEDNTISEDDLIEILNYQKWNGSWVKNNSLNKILEKHNINKNIVNQKLNIKGSENIIITIMVLMCLFTDYSDRLSTWKLSVEKSIDYLSKSGVDKNLIISFKKLKIFW